MPEFSTGAGDRVGAGDGAVSVTVSIINYRSAEMTLDCVRSVLAEAPRKPTGEARAADERGGGLDIHTVIHTVVVDNRSDDGSAEAIEAWIAAQDPPVPVTLVRSATNSGYSGGHNQGIAARASDYVLVLNSDALVRPGAFAALLAAAEAAPDAGLFAPRLEDPDGTPQISAFRLPSPASELIRGAATGPVTALLRRSDMPLGTDPDPAEIGWVSFACVLLRRRMIEAIGPMDEGFFLYFEDTEYCWRAARAGWAIRPVPAARVVHLRGGSAPVKRLAAARKRLPAYYYAARTRCFRLLYGRAGPAAANLAWTLGRGIAQLRRLVGAGVPSASAGELRDIWINAADPLGDRRAPDS